MKVRIIRTVPGYVEGRTAVVGETLDLSTGIALSLISDGFAAAVASASVAPETATANPGEKRSVGRPRKSEAA